MQQPTLRRGDSYCLERRRTCSPSGKFTICQHTDRWSEAPGSSGNGRRRENGKRRGVKGREGEMEERRGAKKKERRRALSPYPRGRPRRGQRPLCAPCRPARLSCFTIPQLLGSGPGEMQLWNQCRLAGACGRRGSGVEGGGRRRAPPGQAAAGAGVVQASVLRFPFFPSAPSSSL